MNRPFVANGTLLLVLFLLFSFPGAGTAAPLPLQVAAAQTDTDLNDVDLRLFIKYVSEISGKKFIIDPKVKGQVSLVAPGRLAAQEALPVLEAALDVLGFATVASGDTIKIVAVADARSRELPEVVATDQPQPGNAVMTRIVRLQHADALTVQRLLGPLMPKTGAVVAYPPTNTLIFSDSGTNIGRLLQIIREIDVPGLEQELTVVPLQNAGAKNLALSLSQLFDSQTPRVPGQQPENRPRFIAEERTNSIVLMASRPETPRFLDTIRRLDRETAADTGNIHVVRLQHADAVELVKVLTELPKKDGAAPAVAAARPKGLITDMQIVADKATNALVITADKNDFAVIAEVIRRLDIPRRMVFLEAAIMEVSHEKNFKLGVEWRAAGTSNGRAVVGGFGGSSTSPFSGMDAIPNLPPGASVGILGQGITVGNIVFPTLGALIEAYKSDSDVNILSTPQILTTDNQEAEIKVGENVPYIIRQETSQTDRDYSSYEYRDVGITLRITPQISENGVVRLQVFQETVKLKHPDAASDKPITLKRSARTTVMVKDRNTVVIGGIIGEDTSSGSFRVPLLGDLPLLGWLFKSQTEIRQKTNLYIFITPRVIDNPGDADDIAHKARKSLAAPPSVQP